MSAALTFGSVGDIIALCGIAWKLKEALGTGPAGAAAEYRELRETLDRLTGILTAVVTTHRQRNAPQADLNGIERNILAIANECGGLIQDALNRLNSRYGPSLSQAGLKNACKKIRFTVTEKNEAESLRKKLSERIDNISLLSGLAAKQSAQVDAASIMTRLDQFHDISHRQGQAYESLAATTRDQSRQLRAIEGRLPVIEQRVEAAALTSQGAHVALCVIVALLEQMAQGLVSLQACVFGWIALRSLRLDATRGLPVRLEDAMGSIIELPLECLYGWQDFDYILKRRFQELGLKGYEKVLRRQYALEDDCSGRDLDRSRPPKAWLRRGMKVNMSMVFAATDQDLTRNWCPRCHSAVVGMEGITVQCKTESCGMWFRVSESNGRIFELGDDDYENDGMMEAFQKDPQRTKTSGPASGRTRASGCEPSDFQRVRLLKTQPEAEAESTSPGFGTIGHDPSQLAVGIDPNGRMQAGVLEPQSDRMERNFHSTVLARPPGMYDDDEQDHSRHRRRQPETLQRSPTAAVSKLEPKKYVTKMSFKDYQSSKKKLSTSPPDSAPQPRQDAKQAGTDGPRPAKPPIPKPAEGKRKVSDVSASAGPTPKDDVVKRYEGRPGRR